MIIENIRYSIISRGENTPEEMPKVGEAFLLHVQKVSQPDDAPQVDIAHITADYVGILGHYAHVMGPAWIGLQPDETLPCDAKYETNRQYPTDTPIGELILKKILTDD